MKFIFFLLLQIILCIIYGFIFLQEDKPWDWDRLFTEVTSELLSQLESVDETSEPNEINQTV